MLSHLDGDRAPALRLFDQASRLVAVFGAPRREFPSEGDTMTTTDAKPTAGGSRIDTGLDVVTGAFSYSGRAIAQRLLDSDRRVRTLTGHPQHADPGGGRSRCGRSTSRTCPRWSATSKA